MNNTNKKQRIYILALGGTIAALGHHPTDEFYHRSSTDINDLLASLPLDNGNIEVIAEQVLHQISHDMTHGELFFVARKINELVNNDDIDGVVITQGTNAIEETAYFINLVVKTKKPIVFTGSFRPRDAMGYDGERNLYNAILCASHRNTLGCGVVLTFNDCIVNARDACKLNPSVMGDFSVNGFGTIGMIHANQLVIHHVVQHKHTYLSEFHIDEMKSFPNVVIIYGHLGVDSIFVKAALENNAKGIISAGMGNGYQPKELTDALCEASDRGAIVVRCSRTGQGTVNVDSKHDDQHGIIAGRSLSPQKARILLAVALTKIHDKTEIQRIFDQY